MHISPARRDRGSWLPLPSVVRQWIVLAVCSLFLLTACDSASTADPNKITPRIVETATPITNTAIIVDGWAGDLSINEIPNAIGEKHILGPLTATPDGELLLGSVQPREWTEQGGTEPGKVVLVDVRSRQVTDIHQFPAADTQAYGATADNNWLIWAEAAQGQDFFGNWTLYAYDRVSHSLKQVATAPRDTGGTVLVGPDVAPKVDHGIVVWAEVSPTTAGTASVVVKSINLATGQIQTLTDNGLTPTISWPYVAWVEPQQQASTQMAGARKGIIIVLNLNTGAKRILKGPDTPSYFALYGESLVWIDASREKVVLTDLDETYQSVLASATGGDKFEVPSLNDRLITWYSRLRTQVWDRVQKNPITLQKELPGFKLINGQTLLWMSGLSEQNQSNPNMQDNGRTIYVLDTSKLSK